MEALSKKFDYSTLVVLAITFALFNLYFWSTNITELDRPFPSGHQYLENAKYPMTVRNATKVLLGKVDEEFEDEDWYWDEKEENQQDCYGMKNFMESCFSGEEQGEVEGN